MKYAIKAFSLIELIVVVTILGILAAIAIPTYRSYSIKARVAALQPVINSYIDAIQSFYGKNGRWPSSTDLGLDPINWTAYSPYLTNVQGLGIGSGWGGTNCNAPGATSIIVAVFDGQKIAGSSNFFTNTWNWGGISNSLAWLTWVYSTNNGSVITSVCGTIGNTNTNDYKYLPPKCQQDLSSFTPNCT